MLFGVSIKNMEPIIVRMMPTIHFILIFSLKKNILSIIKNGTCICNTTTPTDASSPACKLQNIVPRCRITNKNEILIIWIIDIGVFGKNGSNKDEAIKKRNSSKVNGSKYPTAALEKTKLKPHNVVTIEANR